MKALIKIMFLLTFIIYLNDGSIIEAENVSRKYAWVVAYNATMIQNASQSHLHNQAREFGSSKEMVIPITSIRFYSEKGNAAPNLKKERD